MTFAFSCARSFLERAGFFCFGLLTAQRDASLRSQLQSRSEAGINNFTITRPNFKCFGVVKSYETRLSLLLYKSFYTVASLSLEMPFGILFKTK